MLYFPWSYNVMMTLIFMFSAFGINSILYQRGLYPSETFTRVQKYGLTLLVTTDPELIKYLNNVDQLKGILLLDTVLSFAGLNVNRILGLPRWLSGKESTCQCRRHRRPRFHPESGRSPWRGNANSLQYSCQDNPLDRGAGQVTVHWVVKSWIPAHLRSTFSSFLAVIFQLCTG